jgi:hypothetical protein
MLPIGRERPAAGSLDSPPAKKGIESAQECSKTGKKAAKMGKNGMV